jgi:hypothetical protein
MRVSVDGQQVSARTLLVLEEAAKAAGIPRPRILQGSWSDGDKSAGTHAGGGAVDWSVRGLTPGQQERFNVELRRRNGCAWLRTTAYGWRSGDHGHAIIRDEPDLSATARRQVADYDAGRNGLANRGDDPHPRPTQHPVEELIVVPTPRIGLPLDRWPVGKSVMHKTPVTAPVVVRGGKWYDVAIADLPAGGKFALSLQVRMPAGAGNGEVELVRLDWPGLADEDSTGHNVVLRAVKMFGTWRRWRTPIQSHMIDGGGPVAYRILMPAGRHTMRFVAKATRVG